MASEKGRGTHGPLRASMYVRSTSIMDYNPSICKDYKEVGPSWIMTPASARTARRWAALQAAVRTPPHIKRTPCTGLCLDLLCRWVREVAGSG